jgi:asparagine synthase (glutamine-hydrolysing)
LLQKDTPFSSIFAREAVGRIIDQHQEGFNREKQIFLLLSIYFWLESAAHKTS